MTRPSAFFMCCVANACAALLLLTTWSTKAAEQLETPRLYRLEPQHSNIAFALELAGRSRLTLHFRRVDALLEQPAGGVSALRLAANIDAQSLDTTALFAARVAKSPRFLNADRYPVIRFISTRFVRTGADSAILSGNLTIRTTTRPITLVVLFEPNAHDMLAHGDALSFSADGHFSRSVFGLTSWPATVGDDVHLVVHARFVPLTRSR
ncbi:YceI family protein [Trinickia sp. LjRoot230]|uniref:YceI family protein n=1 Tax=Trinickia sp. LjRoot230 TaxID=3342288 RepID=UPI003ECEA9E2